MTKALKARLAGNNRKDSGLVAALIQGVTAPGGRYADVNKALLIGERIRDTYVQYPILPGAITTFQQIASSREWVVTGEPDKAAQAWDYLQNAETVDPITGMTEYGFEQYQKRRILDYLTIGRTSFASRRVNASSSKDSVLKYIDPINLIFRRQELKRTVKDGVKPPKPSEQTWMYHGILYAFEDVIINHPIPQGTRSFIAPVFAVLPMANLVWLLREHDMSSMDGRRIRDIIMVSNTSMQDALEDAIHVQAGLWQGERVEDIGLPIVEINNPTGTAVADMIATLGISKIPDGLDREEVVFEFVNEISGNLGLALRHFWNNERTTNKALEQVQEQRQQQKGPAAYIRTEQRLINSSGFLNRLDGDEENKVKFTFIEETDASIMSTRADVLKKTTEALEKAMSVFGAQISPADYLSWMQSERIMPQEMVLQEIDPKLVSMLSDAKGMAVDGEQSLISDPNAVNIPDGGTELSDESKLQAAQLQAQKELAQRAGELGAAAQGTTSPTSSITTTDGKKDEEEKQKKSVDPLSTLDYGHVAINSAGQILGHRRKVFGIPVIKKRKSVEIEELTIKDINEQIDEWVEEGDMMAYTKVSEIAVSTPDIIVNYLKSLKPKIQDELETAVDYIVSNIQLTQRQADLVDDLYVHILDVEDKENAKS